MTRSHSGDKRENWRRRLWPAAPLALLTGAGALAVAAALTLSGSASHEDPPAGRQLPTEALKQERPHASSVTRPVDPIDVQAARPQRISIPRIGVSAHVVPLRLAVDRTMQTPRNPADAGWYEPGPEPGERGPAVIAGHVDSSSGPAVFYRLRELRRGDVIRVSRADGSVVRFRVEGLERWPKAAFPTRRVFGRTRGSVLRLVTCSGNFDSSTGHYVDNTIVYAARS